MKLPKIFLPEKDLNYEIERLLKDPAGSQRKYDDLEVIRANTYAEGIVELKKRGQKPFIFAENIEARIADYEFNGKDAELFKTWLDSVTGVAYKAHSTKFKLILRSDKLENIESDFRQSFKLVDYNTEQGIEFDSKKDKYNQLLTREEVKNHKFWLAAMNCNKEKLAEYVDIWFNKTKRQEGMGVYLRSNTNSDELRALVVSGDYYDSDAFGLDSLSCDARLVSGAQQK